MVQVPGARHVHDVILRHVHRGLGPFTVQLQNHQHEPPRKVTKKD